MYSDRAINTLNTTRVCGGNHFQNAIEISNVVYADKSPASIIITNGEIIQDALLSTSLIHFPHNAPILYSHTDFIDSETVNQIFKLNPKGVSGTQIFLVGGISYQVGNYLASLGLSIEVITGKSYYETAANVTKYLNNIDNIMLIPSDEYWDGLSACAWAAHMGAPILLITKYLIPDYTRAVIEANENCNVYLFGNQKSISENVIKELQTMNIKYIGIITGNNPYDIAVNFAKYKSPDGKFGWGKTDRNGHAFTFTSAENPFNDAVGSIFAHLGKHSPTLVIKRDELPEVTYHYIESVKPILKEEPIPPYMHGWIIGCENDITYSTQIEIEKALSIDKPHK
ncbi:MAG TPA: cell wall-binding repeat-containing protein [Mobilitalea sp.]|nr:cell wall-binding repeat-containing protein [Mobilitalea sp.]